MTENPFLDAEEELEEDYTPEDATEVIDLTRFAEQEATEADLVSSETDFMEAMEGKLNEDILARQGMRQVRQSFIFTGLDGVEYKLTFKEKLFTEAFLAYKGNSVDAVISAGYDVRKKGQDGMPLNGIYNRKLASVIGYQLLKKLQITSYMATLYEKYGFTDEAVEKELLFLINQKADLKTKAKAIDMYMNLKARYPAKKLDLTTLGQAIVGIEYVTPTTDKPE